MYLLCDYLVVSAPAVAPIAGISAESSGFSLACGDLNGDGLDDVAWGAPTGNGGIHYFDGSGWTAQVGRFGEVLNGIYMSSATQGWAVGDYVSVYSTLYRYDGYSWSCEEKGFVNRDVDFKGVHGFDANNVWAVGSGGTVIKWNGSAWSEKPTGTTSTLYGVAAPDASHLWAVGEGGLVLFSPDGGASWQQQATGVTSTLRGITAVSGSCAWAVGDGGVILFWNGSSWARQGAGLTAANLRAVDAYDASCAWAVGDGGTILGWDGSSWALRSSGTINGLRGVAACSASEAWACGAYGTLLYFNGTSWSLRPQSFTNHLNALYDLGASKVWEAGDPYTGRAYVAFGRAAPPPAMEPDVVLNGLDTFDYAGTPLAVGRFNGDAYHDLLIGATSAAGPGNARPLGGEAYIVNGRDTWPSVIDLRYQADVTIYAADAYDQFPGYAQTPSPDINGDGIDDLLLASRFSDGPGNLHPNGGEVLAIFGGSLPRTIDLMSRPADVTFYGVTAGAEYGYGAWAFDFNGDGLPDLAVTSNKLGLPPDRSANGVTCLVNGRETWPSQVEIEAEASLVVEGAESNDAAGLFVSGANLHSADPDDYQDLVISSDAAGPDNTRPLCGEHYVFLGYDNQPPYCRITGLEEGEVLQGERTVGADAHDHFGVSRVEFLLDGELKHTSLAPPYSWDWSTLGLEDNREYTVTARAWDVHGNYADDSRTVKTLNALPSLSDSWYLAEGSTAWGFEEWVLIQNPGASLASVDVTFMKEDGSEKRLDDMILPPTSRRTVNVASYVGQADVSTRVTSDRPVICERAMYRYDRAVGHDTVGTPALSRSWYLAEGTTAWGFDQWVLVQNPGDRQAVVSVEFMKEDGTVVPYGVVVPPRARYSIHVNEVPGCGSADLSTYLSSDEPIIAERAMYWNGASKPAGHATLGTPSPMPRWYLAEGTTAWGFEEWVLVQNPNSAPCQVTLSFMLPDGSQLDRVYTVAARSRHTVRVNDILPESDVSTMVSSELPIIAERAMYWGGRDGGHCTVGAWSR